MTAFPTLSDEDLNNILAYTAAVPEKKEAAVVAVASGTGAGNDDSSNRNSFSCACSTFYYWQ